MSRFKGFYKPRFTPTPDQLFDELLPDLGEAELKALLYIIRRTFGFKKDSDAISFNQFLKGITTKDGRVLDRGCGIKNRTSLSNALQSLETKGIIVSEKGMSRDGDNETTTYGLNFYTEGEGVVRETYHPEQGVVRQPYHPGTPAVPPVVRPPYPQETGHNKTVKQPGYTSRKKKKESYDETAHMRQLAESAQKTGFDPERFFGDTDNRHD